MSLKLHEFNETDFSGGCLASLGKAANVAVTVDLQRPHTLSFEYPLNDEKADMIQEHRIVAVEGQAYRLTDVTRDYTGTRILRAKATRIFFIDATCKHLPTIGNDTDTAESTIGIDPYKVLQKAVEGTQFSLIPDSELKELGMTRIGADGVKIDFFPTDKINVYDTVTAVIDAYGSGELYVDNFRIAVVERVGEDNGVRLSLTKNLTRLSIQRLTNELCTRLYPYGADDLTISSVNGGKPYIDSPEAIEKYGLVEGYKDYSEYTDPNKIKAHAEYDLMGEDNNIRLDTPQLAITGDVVDLSKLAEYGDFYKIALGDTVHVQEKNIVHHKRIISMTYYPYSAKQPTVTIGSPTLTNPFNEAWQKSKLFKTLQKNSTHNNKIKTAYFTGTLNSTQNPVKSENKQLILDGDLLVINSSTTGKKRLELGNVGGQFALNIYDEDGKRLKIKLGDYGDKYAFAIYDNKGNPAIYMDESGNIITVGTFATGTENEARTVIDKNGIQSYDADGNRYGLWCNEPNKNDQRFADFTIYYQGQEIFQIYNELTFRHLKANGKNFLGTNGDISVAHGNWKFDKGANGSFQTADGKTVTVSGGLITDIS